MPVPLTKHTLPFQSLPLPYLYHNLYLSHAETAVDRLLGDLADEKQSRETLERATHGQAKEFLTRLEKLQRSALLLR